MSSLPGILFNRGCSETQGDKTQDDTQTSLPNPTVLWFSDYVKS